jgi:tRNA A37 methylthiotransferase MiaB
MRRFGDAERFLALLEQVRAAAPDAGVRSNFIVGFPGERQDDVEILAAFLEAARLDAIGVFGYSDEDGTEAIELSGHLDPEEIRLRTEEINRLAEELVSQRAEDRIGERVDVLVESMADGTVSGRAAFQGPDVDGTTSVRDVSPDVRIGDIVRATVVGSAGVDLLAQADLSVG